MSTYDYDLFVIGGGSGGVRAARIAAGYGAKVAIAEEYRVRRHLRDPRLRAQEAAGLRQPLPRRFRGCGAASAGACTAAKLRLADADRQQGRGDRAPRGRLSRGASSSAGVEPSSQARAELVGRAHGASCKPGNRTVTAEHDPDRHRRTPGRAANCPASGTPSPPTRRSISTRLPKSHRRSPAAATSPWSSPASSTGLGVDTTLLYRGAKILRGFDEELRDHLTEELFKRGIDVVCNADIAAIDKGWTRPHRPRLTDGSTVETGQVMFATGRTPNTAGLGLEKAGVELGREGRDRRRRVLALLRRQHLRRRRRHRPRQPDARCHPRGPRLRRHRVRQQADGGRPRAGADRRVLHAGDRHRRPARAHGARALPQARHLQGALPPAEAHAVGARRAHVHEAARRRRQRPGRRLPHARRGRRRDRADGGHRHAARRHQGRLRRHHGAAPDRGRGAGDHAREVELPPAKPPAAQARKTRRRAADETA